MASCILKLPPYHEVFLDYSPKHQHMTPNWANRDRWPTKENMQILCIVCICPVRGENGLGWLQMGQDDFFLLIQTLPTFWAERIWILRMLIFWFFGPHISGFPGPKMSKFPDFQVPRFLSEDWAVKDHSSENVCFKKQDFPCPFGGNQWTQSEKSLWQTIGSY